MTYNWCCVCLLQLQEAVYFLECVIDALASIRPQIVDHVRKSLQGIYPRFSEAFVYPSFTSSSSSEFKQQLSVLNVESQEESEQKEEVEERGQAESLQFLALRNKLRQCTKSILLSSSESQQSLVSYSSSKLD